MSKKTKSTNPALRREAAQSGKDALQDMFGRLETHCATVAILMGFALGSWLTWVSRSALLPWLSTVGLVVALIWIVVKLKPLREEARRRRQGIEGERQVAAWLTKLGPKGFHVFHDVVGDGFNIDHVVVGSKGLFCIETKTSSRPEKDEVHFDGHAIRIGGGPPTDKPLKQVDRSAIWLATRLQSMTGRNFTVKKAILYPNRFVVMKDWNTDVWVLRPSAFLTAVDNEFDHKGLSPEDVCLVADQLETMTRMTLEGAS